tara:strand:- start:11541 stop:12179 length:639 start_codon:yes stop_codon:yes gene_type:complete
MQNPSNLEYLLLVLLAILSGLSVRFALGYAKQMWAMTYHHTMSYALLPAVTMIITTLIAGNLALSLGMIGALSIVRFRNPVKNPFELVIFFALITIGIGISVNVKLGILMTVITIVVILGAKVFENISKKNGKNLFALSFEEGSNVHILEVKSVTSIKILEDNKNLSQFFTSKDPVSYNYRLIFSDKDEVNNLKKSIQDNKDIDSIEVRYAP